MKRFHDTSRRSENPDESRGENTHGQNPSDHCARDRSLIGMGLNPQEFENMQHRQPDQQGRNTGNSDSGRENPEIREQLDQMQREIKRQMNQMEQKLQGKPEMQVEVSKQWWKMQRENKEQLDKMMQKIGKDPEKRKQLSKQWWEIHRENKEQLDKMM